MISKEMENVRVAFKVSPDGKPITIDQLFGQCHIVFDIKMEDFRHKARLVVGGYMTKVMANFIYTGIMSRETVRLALMFATLNDL